jgi:hypothetical protein
VGLLSVLNSSLGSWRGWLVGVVLAELNVILVDGGAVEKLFQGVGFALRRGDERHVVKVAWDRDKSGENGHAIQGVDRAKGWPDELAAMAQGETGLTVGARQDVERPVMAADSVTVEAGVYTSLVVDGSVLSWVRCESFDVVQAAGGRNDHAIENDGKAVGKGRWQLATKVWKCATTTKVERLDSQPERRQRVHRGVKAMCVGVDDSDVCTRSPRGSNAFFELKMRL